jgi:hypothetical protein
LRWVTVRLRDCAPAPLPHDLVQPDQLENALTVQCTAQLELPHARLW